MTVGSFAQLLLIGLLMWGCIGVGLYRLEQRYAVEDRV